MTHEDRLEAYLSAVTEPDIDASEAEALRVQYGIPNAEADALLALHARLDVAFVPIEPSKQFRDRLKADLTGQPLHRPLGRVRNLPTQVQVAAGLLLALVLAVLGRRRLSEKSEADPAEVPVTWR